MDKRCTQVITYSFITAKLNRLACPLGQNHTYTPQIPSAPTGTGTKFKSRDEISDPFPGT
jgi:hypothetical protein